MSNIKDSHQAIDIFPQMISMVRLPDNNIIDTFEQIIKRNNHVEYNHRDNRLKHYHNNENVLSLYPELKQTHDDILNAANYVYQDVLNHTSDLRFTNSWFNECDIGGSQNFHNHCNSVLSGTVYYVTDKHTNLMFQSPYHSPSIICNSLQDEPDRNKPNSLGYNYHHSHVTIPIEQNMCLFWESYLHHGYNNNQTPNRMSLSFNLLPNNVNQTYKI
jgi:uncharacterized protein (TIGR02466 family)|tara:strand:+ start:593 stop:1240 length:648 start_codon:yes stop_codon:yes gene_type:complete